MEPNLTTQKHKPKEAYRFILSSIKQEIMATVVSQSLHVPPSF